MSGEGDPTPRRSTVVDLSNVRVNDVDLPTSVAIEDGLITAIGPQVARADALDCEGMLLLPGLVEPHLHLDKALLSSGSAAGGLAEAIAATTRLKAGFTLEDVLSRGRAVLDKAIANGTTAARLQTDVDPAVGTLSVQAMLMLRDSYAHAIDLQVVAFPQEGIIDRPGTLELLRQCLALGADVIGGCTYSETTVAGCRQHIDTVLDLAQEFGVPADFHADFADDDGDPRFAMADYLSNRTLAQDMAGQVAVGHLTSLGGTAEPARSKTIQGLADAGVAVICLPATDLYLGGRSDRVNIRRGLTPIAELRAAGVLTAVSSNNIRNAFTPFGNADQFETALLLAQTSHLGAATDLAAVLDMASTAAARVIGLPGPQLVAPGARADLIVVAADTAASALLDRAPRRYVLKAGVVVAETITTRISHHHRGSVDDPHSTALSVR
jgi:cytosine/creatinine deaminase